MYRGYKTDEDRKENKDSEWLVIYACYSQETTEET